MRQGWRRSVAAGNGEGVRLTVEDDRREVERRSPVGDFLLGALALRADGMRYAELLQIAGESGLNMSIVLAWVARAEEAGLIVQQVGPGGEGRSLLLSDRGIDIARSNRRRFHRRERWQAADASDL